LRRGGERGGEGTCRERPGVAADLAEPVHSSGPDLLKGDQPAGGGKAALLVWPPRVGESGRERKLPEASKQNLAVHFNSRIFRTCVNSDACMRTR
jgi:hypothetical protein